VVLVATILIGFSVLVGWWSPGPDGGGGWIYEYQTLIAGTGAVLAAVVTIHSLRRQTNASEQASRRALRVAIADFNRDNISRLREYRLLLRSKFEESVSLGHSGVSALQKAIYIDVGGDLGAVRALRFEREKTWLLSFRILEAWKILESRRQESSWATDGLDIDRGHASGDASVRRHEERMLLERALDEHIGFATRIEELCNVASHLERLLAQGWRTEELRKMSSRQYWTF